MTSKIHFAGWIPLVIAFAVAPRVEASLIYSGGSYSQNFDSLLASPASTNHAWADNSTLAGWYSNRTSYRSSTGSDNTGSLYSFGAASAVDRALGSIASGGTGTILFGLRLQNNTSSTFSEFTVTYDGEQWRNGGNTTSIINSLAFGYQIGTGLAIGTGTYTLVPSLNFTGPISTPGSAVALDGNNAANRVAGITFTVTGINWAPGQELFLRWSDPNDAGNDHGLGIDNFSFLANAIPEPATVAWFGLILVGGAFIRRRSESHS